jgi:hypothetical protein
MDHYQPAARQALLGCGKEWVHGIKLDGCRRGRRQ